MKRDHVDLLRDEHIALQTKYADLCRKFDAISLDRDSTDSFVERILSAIRNLRDKKLFSDVCVHVEGEVFATHKLILSAHSNFWGDLSTLAKIDVSDVPAETFRLILNWMYTDEITVPTNSDDQLIALTSAASKFRLPSLIKRCESALSACLTVRNCVRIYELAEKEQLTALRDKCGAIVAAKWIDFGPDDFANLSAPLLYRMLKSQSANPLHSIIELGREDALFLYFMENNNELPTLLNTPSPALPLETALLLSRHSIASQLIQNGALASALYPDGDSPLLRCIRAKSVSACRFLSTHGASLSHRTPKGEGVAHAVAGVEDRDMVEWMKEARPPMDGRDGEGRTAVLLAVRRGNDIFVDAALDMRPNSVDDADNEGVWPLSLALLDKSDLSLAGKLVAAGADVNKKDDNGSPLLHRAIFVENAPAVEFLLSHSVDVDAVDCEDRSAVHECVSQQCVPLLRLLLAHSPSLSGRDMEGRSVLRAAVEDGQLAMAALLIEKGAAVDEEGEGGRLIEQRLRAGDDPAAEFLLRHGAAIGGCSLPHLAALSGCPLSLRAMCSRGVDANSLVDGVSLIETALLNGQFSCAKELLSLGCQLSPAQLTRLADGGHETAALFMAQNGCTLNWECVLAAVNQRQCLLLEELVRKGAPLDSQDAAYGRTAAHLAVAAGDRQSLDVLLQADDVGFLAVRDRVGLTPLTLALHNNHHECASAVMARQPHAALHSNGNGENALHSAVRNAQLESVLFLIGAGVDASRPTKCALRRSALHLACDVDEQLIMRNLLLAGCPVDSRCSDGTTPLHWAARNGRDQHVRILLDHGANANLADGSGNNALHVAVSAGQCAAARALLHSPLDSRAVNARGHSALHLCSAAASAAIAGELAECLLQHESASGREMSGYVDGKDLDGNTALLLAYQRGQASVCRSVLRRGAAMGARNADGVSVFNHPTPTRQLLFALLDSLEREPKWSDGENCSDCDCKFGITTRKHHCRHCGRVVCAKCSETTMPIVKFGEDKKVRVCGLCAQVLTSGSAR